MMFPCITVKFMLIPSSLLLNTVAFSILRPLPPDFIFRANTSIREMCIRHCRSTRDTLVGYFQTFSTSEYSCMVMNALYNALITLLSLLDDPATHDLFSQFCALIYSTLRYFHTTKLVLHGVHALTS